MCPPIEMLEMVNVSSRLSPSHNTRPLSSGLMPRLRMTTTAAPIRPKMPPDAPTVSEFGSISSTPREPANTDTKKISPKRTEPIAGSSSWPRIQSANMLKKMWKKLACRKPAVSRRQ